MITVTRTYNAQFKNSNGIFHMWDLKTDESEESVRNYCLKELIPQGTIEFKEWMNLPEEERLTTNYYALQFTNPQMTEYTLRLSDCDKG